MARCYERLGDVAKARELYLSDESAQRREDCQSHHGRCVLLRQHLAQRSRVRPFGDLERLVQRPGHGVHTPVPAALSVTQATEYGTVYSLDEVGELVDDGGSLVGRSNGGRSQFESEISLPLGASDADDRHSTQSQQLGEQLAAHPETYDGGLEDIFRLQDSIARSIVEALKIELVGTGDSLVDPETDDVEAYTLLYEDIENDEAVWNMISALVLFADYTQNTEVSQNDTGYLLGAKYGSARDKGDWDLTYFYEHLEADATVGLVADSDFGGGGTARCSHGCGHGSEAGFDGRQGAQNHWWVEMAHVTDAEGAALELAVAVANVNPCGHGVRVEIAGSRNDRSDARAFGDANRHAVHSDGIVAEDVVDLFVEDFFGQAEGRNLAAHETATGLLVVVEVEFVTQGRKVPGNGKGGRTTAQQGNFLAVLLFRHLGQQISHWPLVVSGDPLQATNGNRFFL